MKVNDTYIPVYDLDTTETIISRIAQRLNTLPKYLYFRDEFVGRQDENINIRVDDLLQQIRNDNGTSFSEFVERLGSNVPSDLEIVDGVLKAWLSFNPKIEQYRKNSAIIGLIKKKLVDEGYGTESEIDSLWLGRENDHRAISNTIKRNELIAQQIESQFEEFDQVKQGLPFTDLQTEKTVIDIPLNITDITLLELFNNAQVSETAPFMTVQKYYKILKDFIPHEEWARSNDDFLTIYVLYRHNEKKIEYNPINVRVDGDFGQQKVIARTKITSESSLLQSTFIDRFLGIMGNLQSTEIIETELTSFFFFPNAVINTYVFSDLVMNDRLFSKLFSIDESTKATKYKGDSTQPWLYVHFNHASTGHVTASITQKYATSNDQEIRDYRQEIPINSAFIRVRAHGKDREALNNFQNMLAKLLVIYQQKHDAIVKIYQQFIPGFGKIVAPKNKQEGPEKLKNLEPDIFVNNYSRTCLKNQQPTIVDEKQAEQYEEQGQQVMVYPRSVPNQGKKFPSDGKNQRYYVCLNPDFPFPGVQENKLTNKKEYPFVPCCFRTDQTERKNYQEYFFGKSMEREKKQQELIITDKIIEADQYGELPDKLENLLETLDHKPNHRYIRHGLFRNKSSFLNAVMTALNNQTGILELSTEQEVTELLNQIREILSEPQNAVLCRQNNFEESFEQIRENIRDENVYLNPRLYCQLLESYFSCNIFLFNRDRPFLPNYTQAYYRYKNKNACIFIYEHIGSESDRAEYPQCELITHWNVKKRDDIRFVYNHKSTIAQKIRKVFRSLSQAYTLNKKITETVFPLNNKKFPEITLVKQNIDTYGKTRQLNVMFGDHLLSLMTEPIAPLRIVMDNERYVHYIDFSIVERFLSAIDGEIVSQNAVQGKVREINCVLGNVFFSIPIKPKKIDDKILTVNTSLSYVGKEKDDSLLFQYNQNKMIARYITEYSFWLFSLFVKKKNAEIVDDDLLQLFARKKILVDSTFVYDSQRIPKNFSMESGLMKDGRLVVSSKDMRKRIMYVLKMYAIRNLSGLMNYYQRNVIEHYYVDITDFDTRPHQIILQGEDSLDQWINENKFTYRLHSSISVESRLPYFFKNSLIENHVFLAQNTDSLNKALEIAINWQKEGYNTVPYSTGSINTSFTLYSYVNSGKITKHFIRTGQDEPISPIRLIGYKLSNQPFYTVLLEV